MYTGSRQTNRVRSLYLKSVLRQDVQFFDRDATTGKLLMGLNEETIAYQHAISEKVRSLFAPYVAYRQKDLNVQLYNCLVKEALP